ENKVAYKTIPQSIDAVINEEVDLVVVPIENAIEGTVHLTIDYLVHQKRLPICAELVVPIKQNLLINSNFVGELKNITGVYSHTQAIAQTQQYIHNELPNASIEYTDSTGSAAELVSKSSEPIAAIGNVLAAKENGLTIAKKDIYDNKKNKYLIKIKQEVVTEKTTLLITLPEDRAGVLHQVLSAFAWRKMSLSKIESRPMKTGLGNYFFIIDVNEPFDDVLFPGVKGEL